jgi:uncharacterized protein YukE
MADDSNRTSAYETQRTRRMKYGTNVAVSIVAALALMVLLNWMAQRNFQRFDFTATRRYSLSEKTHKVLDRLEKDHQLVTLLEEPRDLPRRAELMKRLRDLTEEYARYSEHLSGRHINPASDVQRLEQFYGELESRYKDELRPAREATNQAQSALETLRNHLARIRSAFGEQDAAPLEGSSLAQFGQRVRRALGRMDQRFDATTQQVQKALDRPLPAVGQAQDQLGQLFSEIEDGLLKPLSQRIDSAAQKEGLSGAAQERVLAIQERVRAARDRLKPARQRLQENGAPEDYAQLREQLQQNPDTVVLLGPERVQALAFKDLYKQSRQAQQQQGERATPEITFLGEEKITGALISQTLEQRPLVVFVNPGQRPATGQRGRFSRVAEQLQAANFQVEEWQPGGGGRGRSPRRRGGQNAEPPEPKPGQRSAWILLPGGGGGRRAMMMGGGGGGSRKAVEHLRKRLAAGDGALVLTQGAGGGGNPMQQAMGGGGGSPVEPLLQEYGVRVQSEKTLLRQAQGRGGQSRAVPQVTISNWPDASPIGRALSGTRGVFLGASPLKLDAGRSAGTQPADQAEDGEKVEATPIAQVQGRRIWPSSQMPSPRQRGGEQPEFKPEKAGGPFVTVASVQKGKTRLVVAGGSAWASDRATGYGRLGPGTADMAGAAFPANVELFVNGVYWLVGLDDLIAAGAETQAIPRLAGMARETWWGLFWSLVLGLPALVFALGIGVWVTRRS